MSNKEIIYLGPAGTFAYEVAKKRYGYNGHRLVSEENIGELCRYVARKESSRSPFTPVSSRCAPGTPVRRALIETAISALKQQSHVGRNDSTRSAGIVAPVANEQLVSRIQSTIRPSGATAPMR